MEGFIKIRNELRPNTRVRIRMTVQEKNRHEFNDYLSFWQSRLGDNDYAYGKLLHNWASWLKDYALPVTRDNSSLNLRPCSSLWSSFIVLTDGRVPLCCSDYNAKFQLGDIKSGSIKEIWQGDAFTRARKAHLRGGRNALDICKDCNVWDSSSRVGSCEKEGEKVCVNE